LRGFARHAGSLDAKRVLYVRGGGDPFLISEELVPGIRVE